MSHPSGHPGPHGLPPHRHQPGHHPGYSPAPLGGYTGPPGGPPVTTGMSDRSLGIAAGCFVVLLALAAVAAGLWQFHSAGRLPVSSDPLIRETWRDSAGRLHTFGTTMLLLASIGFIGGYLLIRGKAEAGVTLMVLVGLGCFGGGMVGMALAMMGHAMGLAVMCVGMVIVGVVMLGLAARQLLLPMYSHPPSR
ncbi:Uncharacterised protein [Nocardia cyriacigeorgica]|uniref:Uncharacterized protein n=1 Tax=Nocardia cyriacigeorgica TaxID=135487 RepID=A0A4U8W5Y8_9NOCA|nr:Uncharacterised protein [Nocardia cyriacigeorgica]